MVRPLIGRFVGSILLLAPTLVSSPSVLESADITSRETVKREKLAADSVAVLTERHELFLEATPRRGEGISSFAIRYCGTTDVVGAIAAANGGSRQLRAGVRYRIPFNLVEADYQLRIIQALFEGDRAVSAGWRHRIRVTGTESRESLWRVAEWFTGDGQNYRLIRESNQLTEDDLAPGQVVIIPARILRPAFRAVLPPTSPYQLEYGKDDQGEFAIYKLKSGEALYTSVVMRFTGHVFADDVNALAQEVAIRSGIVDVTDIPIGYEVKMPFELLLPEFLPAGDPRRREYEDALVASARFSNEVKPTSLQGVTLILDAGHGGKDVGASIRGVWESVYVYDIMVRTKILLEGSTAATVIATTQDGNTFRPLDKDRLPYSKGHRVLTTPNYKIEDSRVGVHLRWYLANSIYRQAVEKNGDAEKVTFVSIHADSLHPSLRGAMVYIPGAQYRKGTYGKSGTVYASRREVKEHPRVTYSSRDRVKSEGLSRELATKIIDSFESADMPVHPYKPIREKVIRSKRAWVPAVLRYNAVPAKVLVEVCNLANTQDLSLIQTREFRQQVARVIVNGILSYYGQQELAPGMRVASTSP